MKTADKKRTAETLKEKPVKIKVGWLSFKIKPLTLMQIYEMSVFANDIKKPSWKDGDSKRIRDAALYTFVYHYTFAAKSKSLII